MLCFALLQHQLPPSPAELPAPGKIGRTAGGWHLSWKEAELVLQQRAAEH